MELTGNTFTIVPHGWQRLLEGTRVVYISPDNKRLSNNEELLRHLTTPGTCKCGLRCPFSIDELFSFDPDLISLPDSRPFNQDALCKQANHLRLVKNRRSQAVKKQGPLPGVHPGKKKSGRPSVPSATATMRLDAGSSAHIAQPIVQLQSLISHLNTMASRQSAEGLTNATIPLQWLAAAGIHLQAPVSSGSSSDTSKPTQQIALMIPSSLAGASLATAATSSGKVRKSSSSRAAKQAKTSRTPSSSSSPVLDSELLSSQTDTSSSRKLPGKYSSARLLLSRAESSSLLHSLPVSYQTKKCILPPAITTERPSLPHPSDNKETSEKASPTHKIPSSLVTSSNQSNLSPQTSSSQPFPVFSQGGPFFAASSSQASPSEPVITQTQTEAPLLLSSQTGPSPLKPVDPSYRISLFVSSPSQPLAALPQKEPSSNVASPEVSSSLSSAVLPCGESPSALLYAEAYLSQRVAASPQGEPSTALSSQSNTLPQAVVSQETDQSQLLKKPSTSLSQPLTTSLPETLPTSVSIQSQPLASLPQSDPAPITPSQVTSPFHPLVAVSQAPPVSVQASESSVVNPLSTVPPPSASILPGATVSSQPLVGPSSLKLPFEVGQSHQSEIQPPVGTPFLGDLLHETGPLQGLYPPKPTSHGLPPQSQFPQGLPAMENLSQPTHAASEDALYQFLEPSIDTLADSTLLHEPSCSEASTFSETGAGTFHARTCSPQAVSHTSQTETGTSQTRSCTSQAQTGSFQAESSPRQSAVCGDQSLCIHSSNANNNNVPFLTQGYFTRKSSREGLKEEPVDLGKSKSSPDNWDSSYDWKHYNLRGRSSSRDSNEPFSDKSTASSGRSPSEDSSSILSKGKDQPLESVALVAEEDGGSFAYPSLVCSEFNLRKRKERSSSTASLDRKSSISPESSGSSTSISSTQSKPKTSDKSHSKHLRSSEMGNDGKSTGKVCPGSASGSTSGQSDELFEESPTIPMDTGEKKSCPPTGKSKCPAQDMQLSSKRHSQKRRHSSSRRSSVSDFTSGDIVWAKAPQLPAWPGRIITYKEWTKDKLKRAPPGKVWVNWFAAETVSLVPVNNLHPLKEGYQSAQGSIKKSHVKKINMAMKEALAALEVREQQKAAGRNC